MKGLKVTILVLVLLMAMAAPAFANTADDTPVERIEPQYRTEIHRKTDEFLFSNDIQNRLAEEGIKVVYTAPIDDSTVEIGIYPDEAAARETVLNLLVENTIGSSENFEVIHSEEVTIMPFTTDEPAEDAPDVIEDPDTPVSDYVRPDDENAEIGITSVDDLAADGEEESGNLFIPIIAVLGLGGAAGGIFYLKR